MRPSDETDRARPTPARSSLALRVALGTAVSAALVAVLAAATSLLVADRLVRDGEDGRLRAAASAFAGELPRGGDRQSTIAAIAQEEAELAPASIRITVMDASSLVGGDARLPSPPSGTCASYDARDTTLRVCAVQAGAYRVIVGSTRLRRGATLLLVSCVVAALLASVAAAMLGRRSARWALAPLTRLRHSLDRIDADEPRRVVLAGDDACREVAALRAALNGLLARLADALDAARGFSADAAHELRTPLTVIRAELDLLAEEPIDPSTARSIEKLRVRVSALVTLTERLLALATAADRASLAAEAVALEDVVHDVVARLDADARTRVRIHAHAAGMVHGDEALLAAVVENAVENALKFSGNEPVDVEIHEEDERVVLHVADRGPGLDGAERVRAFQAFFRAATSRGQNSPGHGIGLALVARIVAAHHGTVAFVDPEPGKTGVRLRVDLPGWAPPA